MKPTGQFAMPLFNTFKVGDFVTLAGGSAWDGIVIPKPDLSMCWHNISKIDVMSNDGNLVFIAIGAPPEWKWTGWTCIEADRLERVTTLKYPLDLRDLPLWQADWKRESVKALQNAS